MELPTRELIAQDALARVEELRSATTPSSSAAFSPSASSLLRHLDLDNRGAHLGGFTPALPFDTAGRCTPRNRSARGPRPLRGRQGLLALAFRRRRAAQAPDGPDA
jgi:hypothetical protein